jgi:hypothetical protein
LARSKTHKEVEHYLGEIKELRSTVRKLQRELAYYKKREHISDDIIAGVLDVTEGTLVEKKEKCPKCQCNNISFVVIGVRGFKICDCGYRSLPIKMETKE